MKNTNKILLALFLTIIFLPSCASNKLIKQQKTNKEVLKMWFEEGWNKDKAKELVSICFDENWEDGNPILPDQMMGHEGMYQLLDKFNNAFTDIHFDLTHVFSEGDFVCVRYNVDAKHTGDFFGVPPTNKIITTTGMAVYEKDNVIMKMRNWNYLGIG